MKRRHAPDERDEMSGEAVGRAFGLMTSPAPRLAAPASLGMLVCYAGYPGVDVNYAVPSARRNRCRQRVASRAYATVEIIARHAFAPGRAIALRQTLMVQQDTRVIVYVHADRAWLSKCL